MNSQTSLCSEGPSVGEVNTPMDLEFHESWTLGQQQQLLENCNYHRNMLHISQDLIQRGKRAQIFPKKPKSGLETIVKPHQMKPAMSLQDVHKLLAKSLITRQCETWTPYFGTSLEQTTANLKEGLAFIRTEEKKLFGVYIAYGKVLTGAFLLHRCNIHNIGQKWKEWLKENVGIEESYARKLRNLYKELDGYQKFKRLGVSYAVVYKYFTLIKLMLLDADIATFWKQP